MFVIWWVNKLIRGIYVLLSIWHKVITNAIKLVNVFVQSMEVFSVSIRVDQQSTVHFTYMRNCSLIDSFALIWFEGAYQKFAHAFAEISRQDCIQERIYAGIEVRC